MDERFDLIYRQLYGRYSFLNSVRLPPNYESLEGMEGEDLPLIFAEEFVERVVVEMGRDFL